jgi:hypothetical protein
MKISGFKQYINENIYNITPITAAGSVDIRNPDDIDQINTVLNFVTGDKFITPYVAFEKVQKVLAQYMIFPTKPPMFEGDSGLFTCPISQFGDKSGQELDGTMVKSGGFHGKDETHGSHEPGESFHGDGEKSIEKKDDETYHFYFEYRLSDCGMFRIFAEVVNDDELEELLGDLEDEMNDEEEEDDEELNESRDDHEDKPRDFDRKSHEEKIAKMKSEFEKGMQSRTNRIHKMLKRQGVREENLQELSKDKLRKYIDRSMSDWHHQDMTAKYANTDKERALGKLKKANRAKGISRAIDKEEGKNLQELSRGKLADYVAASSTDMSNRLKKSHQELSNATTRFNRGDKPEAVQAHSDAADREYKKASKRQTGIYKAVRKLAK